MAQSIRNPTALLTLFSAIAAAAPQRGGHGGNWRTWTQQVHTYTTAVAGPVVTVTTVDPQFTANSPPILPPESGASFSTIDPSTLAAPSSIIYSSVGDSNPTQAEPTYGNPEPTQAEPTLQDPEPSQADPTYGNPESTQVSPTQGEPSQGGESSYSASGTQPTQTGSSGGGGGSGGGHCQGESCRPGGKKAGIAGANGAALLGDAISWFYDWSPNPSAPGSNAIGVPMLWGNGKANEVDAQRFKDFASISQPSWVLGFNEPDIGGDNSAGMDAGEAAQVWNDVVVPKIGSSTNVGSPAPAIQNGHWLTDFKNSGISADWDITAIHIYKTTAEDAKGVVDYYASQFPGKAIWITEWACVDTSTDFVGCDDQGQITQFIADMVDMFEEHPDVQGYSAITEGYKLPEVWNFVSNGQLTTSGNAYLSAISKY